MATDETRARILEAAGPIFADRGFQGATVREICDAAGAGLASINYHFGDKQHLYAQVVESAFEDLSRLRPPMNVWPAGTPVETKLRSWILRLAERTVEPKGDTWQERLLTREIQSPSPECEAFLRRRIRNELDPLFAILGEILPADAPEHDRWHVAFSITGQLLHYDSHRGLIRLLLGGVAGNPHYGTEQIAEHITRFCLAAFGMAPSIGKTGLGEQP
jgi:AcrR family transcriptional regulator